MGLKILVDSLKKNEPKQPKKRTLADEGRTTLDAQRGLMPDQLGLEQEYGPEYGRVQAGAMGDILDEVGPRALAAYRAANPDQAALLDELNRQAIGELGLGASLDDSLRREVQEGVRSGQSARGMGFGPSDLYEEAMEIGSRGEAMRGRRRDFANTVAGRNQEQLATIPGLAGQAYAGGLSRTPSFDPFENEYAQDLYNTVYNAGWANKLSIRNYNAAVTGAVISAVGQILGGVAGGAAGCWVAREVFGWWDPKWICFRSWLCAGGPARRVLRHIYNWWGPWLARWIADKPRVKRWLRRWMLRKIGGED